MKPKIIKAKNKHMEGKILVLGSEGQIGSELIPLLRTQYGTANVIAADIRSAGKSDRLFRRIDVTEPDVLLRVVKEFRITTIFHLVSILSAKGESDPAAAWMVNIEGLRNVLEISRREHVKKVFWPSSIAAFGPHSPRTHTNQFTVMDPNTMYGITKVAGELLCSYYAEKYGLDVRCLRYPGIISWKTPPGGGTTDYAVAMLRDALVKGRYSCFLRADTMLPMMYMPDALRATLAFMEAPREKLRTRSGYNLMAISFSPRDLTREICRHIPGFTCSYEPDERQKIADSWPRSINDSRARKEWGWRPQFTLRGMVTDMLYNLSKFVLTGKN